MTDKKFTDEEIIKRLERCVKRGNRNYNTDIVLDLINRQKAEIERLKGSVITNNIMESQRIKRETKAEAYKDFAEKLKVAAISCSIGGRYYKIFTTRDIDNFLKEMVGEEE